MRDVGDIGTYEEDIALQISDVITCYGKPFRLSKDRYAINYHNRKRDANMNFDTMGGSNYIIMIFWCDKGKYRFN